MIKRLSLGLILLIACGSLKAVSPVVSPNLSQIAKAWVNFTDNAGTIVINKSFNVTSITRNGTGDYTINFTSALADTNYVLCAYYKPPAATGGFTYENPDAPIRTVNAIRIYTVNNAGTLQNAAICSVIIFD